MQDVTWGTQRTGVWLRDLRQISVVNAREDESMEQRALNEESVSEETRRDCRDVKTSR